MSYTSGSATHHSAIGCIHPGQRIHRVLEVRVEVCVYVVVVPNLKRLLSVSTSHMPISVPHLPTYLLDKDCGAGQPDVRVSVTIRCINKSGRDQGGGLTGSVMPPRCDTCRRCNRTQRTMWRKGNVVRLRERSNVHKFGNATAVGDLGVIDTV